MGVMILGAAIVVVAIWTAVLSVKLSKLNKLLLMEQERSAELSRRLSAVGRRNAGASAQGIQAVSPSGMPLEAGVETAPSEGAAAPRPTAERAKKPKSRKSKPTIPFGANKEAQTRARQAYADMVDDDEYDPDSIDFNKVEGLRSAQLGTMPANARSVRSASSGTSDVSVRQQGRGREPKQRNDARALELQKTGKMPTVTAREATSETKASFDRVGEELRSRNGVSSAWVEEDARRVVERHERAAKRQRLSERRHHEQLRRQAESIVAEHHRQMTEARTQDR